MATYERFNARRSHTLILRKEFYAGGVLADPSEIAKVVIYKGDYDAASPDSGKVVEITPATKDAVGKYSVSIAPVPITWEAGVYYRDVWFYTTVSGAAQTVEATTSFHLFDNNWFTTNGFSNFRFSVFPDLKMLTKGEKRNITLECGSTPLYRTDPVVDAGVVPITGLEVQVMTAREEVVDAWTSTIIRNAGTQFLLYIDTSADKYRKGNYFYQVRMTLPDGSIQVSQRLVFAIS